MRSPWPEVPLGEILKERQEVPDEQDILTGKIRIISKIGFNDGKIQLREETATRTKMILVRPGDLVISGINAAKGAIAIYGGENEGPVTATIHYGSYIPNKSKVELKYLWWLLRSHTFRDLLLKYVPGGIKTELKAKRLFPIPISLPPLSEQRRILAKIKKIEKRVNELKKHREDSLVAISKIITSISFYVFDRYTNIRKFGDVFDVTKLAGFEYTKHVHYVNDGKIIMLRAQNVKNTGLKLKQVKYITEDLSNFLIRCKLFKDDLVITFIGAGTGESAIIGEDNKYHCAPNIAKLSVKDKTKLLPKFALAQIRSPFVQDQIKKITRYTAQPCLSMRIIRELNIRVPPVDEQKSIVSSLQNTQEKIEFLQRQVLESKTEINALMPSILSKAFVGEL